jgi:hypothetical protein
MAPLASALATRVLARENRHHDERDGGQGNADALGLDGEPDTRSFTASYPTYAANATRYVATWVCWFWLSTVNC